MDDLMTKMVLDDLVAHKAHCAKHGWNLTDKVLGKGGFAIVMLATLAKQYLNHPKCPYKVAIKIINTYGQVNRPSEIREMVANEIKTLRSVRGSKNIVNYINSFQYGQYIYIVMEYAQNGELVGLTRPYRHAGVGMPEEKVRNIIKQVAEGVQHCHRNNIVHKDIKPENILVTKDNTMKISDFGLAHEVKEVFEIDFAGTRRFMAPEMHRREPHDAKITDIWSLGALLFFLLCGKNPGPSEGVECTKENLLSAARTAAESLLKERPYLSPECVDFIRQVLCFDCMKRPGIEEIVKHAWLAEKVTQNSTNRKRKSNYIDEIAREKKLFKEDRVMVAASRGRKRCVALENDSMAEMPPSKKLNTSSDTTISRSSSEYSLLQLLH